MDYNGPFETEEQARMIPAVRAVYEAYDHGQGTGDLSGAPLILAACEAAGVGLGAYDARIVAWLGNWEPTTCAVIAGLIFRAHEAEKAAATADVESEWGARFRDPGGRLSSLVECGRGADAERTARDMAGTSRKDDLTGIVLRREVGPWKEVPDA